LVHEVVVAREVDGDAESGEQKDSEFDGVWVEDEPKGFIAEVSQPLREGYFLVIKVYVSAGAWGNDELGLLSWLSVVGHKF
jgi:hypothetical protein